MCSLWLAAGSCCAGNLAVCLLISRYLRGRLKEDKGNVSHTIQTVGSNIPERSYQTSLAQSQMLSNRHYELFLPAAWIRVSVDFTVCAFKLFTELENWVRVADLWKFWWIIHRLSGSGKMYKPQAEPDAGLFMSLSPHRVPDRSHPCQHRSQSTEFPSTETLVISVYYSHRH